MLCTLTPRGTAWFCSHCGLILPRREGEPAPRVACAGRSARLPRPAPRPPAQDWLTRYDALLARQGGPDGLPSRAVFVARGTACRANLCGQFDGRGCRHLPGSPCRAADRLFERLLFGSCPRWEDRS